MVCWKLYGVTLMKKKDYAGIYIIKNLINNKVYVGSSFTLRSRKSKHFSDLKNHTHDNKHLQASYDKYGKEFFEFKVLCYVELDLEYLLYLENEAIKIYDATNKEKGYNIRKNASSNWGIKFSEEARSNMSKARIGMKLSEETKRKLSEIHKNRTYASGWKMKKETKEKLSYANGGSNNYSAKLTEESVFEIKKLIYENNLSPDDIAKIYNVTAATIYHIKENKSWKRVLFVPNKEVTPVKRKTKYNRSKEVLEKISIANTGSKNSNAKLDEMQVWDIRKLLSDGVNGTQIAAIFGVNERTVSAINREKTWKKVIYDPQEKENPYAT
jgi:group I intron endonuclease